MKTKIETLLAGSSEKWIVATGRGLDLQAIFNSLEAATQWVRANLIENATWSARMRETWSDDNTPLGTFTGMSWECPSRPMTKDEALATGNRYAKEWIKSKNLPNTQDYAESERRGVKFVSEQLSNILIERLSSHLGYMQRASALNDISIRLTALEALISK